MHLSACAAVVNRARQRAAASARARRARQVVAAELHAPPVGTCTAETPRCGNARYYEYVLPECCRGHLIHIVAAAVDAFEAAGVTYWADYGTLLGAVRNPMTTMADYPWLGASSATAPIAPGIIPHDKDADFSALATDWQKLLQAGRELRKLGLQVTERAISRSLKIRLSPVNHTNLDVFTWFERADGVLFRKRYCAVDRFKGREITKAQLLPLTRVSWEGLTLPAPHNPVAFCEHRYGPDWLVPVCANHDGVPR